MSELKEMLKNIRAELEVLYTADFTDEEREEKEDNGEAYDIYSYLTDVLDYEYTINSNREYKGVKLWVTLGGPNIHIDTRNNEIRGVWGSERESIWLPSEICDEIDIIFEEIYNN